MAGAAIKTVPHAPDHSPSTLITGIIRENMLVFDALRGEDLCPPAPEDISVLTRPDKSEFRPAGRADLIAYGEQQGLTFPDSEEVAKAQNDILYHATTIEQVTDILNHYSTTQLNIPIKMQDFDKYPQELPDMASYKDSSIYLMEILSLLPSSLLKQIDLSAILIKPLDAESSNLGSYEPVYKTVSLDINAMADPMTILHEIAGHGAQTTACHGYAIKDGALISQNPPGFAYVGEKWRDNPHYPISTTASAYGQLDVREDDADIAAGFILGTVDIQPGKATSPIAKKTGIIFDRLNQLAPGSANYLAAVGPYLAIPFMRDPRDPASLIQSTPAPTSDVRGIAQ